jgi:SAM-dependent methyltransferase
MEYDDAAAEQLEAVYVGRDIVQQRQHTLELLAPQPGEAILDIGSGPGFLVQEIAEIVGPSGQVAGVDLSSDMIRRSTDRNERPYVSYAEADATALPYDDASFDAVVSTQVAEYVPDAAEFCARAFRVLKPGGRALVLATDWRGVVWNSDNPDRMVRVMKAFEPHCADPSLPGRLGRLLADAGFADITATGFPIVNIDWSDQNYSCTAADFVAGYVRGTGTIDEAELTAWRQELEDLAAEGRYFYSTMRTIFQAKRPG